MNRHRLKMVNGIVLTYVNSQLPYLTYLYTWEMILGGPGSPLVRMSGLV
jgi:hypothetical protein